MIAYPHYRASRQRNAPVTRVIDDGLYAIDYAKELDSNLCVLFRQISLRHGFLVAGFEANQNVREYA
jgi:hypothetical protein